MTVEEFAAALSFRALPEVRSGPPLAVVARRLAAIAFPSRAYEDFYVSLLASECAALDGRVPPPTVGELVKATLVDYACRTCWMNGAVIALEPAGEVERRAPLFSTGLLRETPAAEGLWVLYGRYESFVRTASTSPLPHDAGSGFGGLEARLRALARPGHVLRCVSYGAAVGLDDAAASLAAVRAGYGRAPELVLLESGDDGRAAAARLSSTGARWELAAALDAPGSRLLVLRPEER